MPRHQLIAVTTVLSALLSASLGGAAPTSPSPSPSPSTPIAVSPTSPRERTATELTAKGGGTVPGEKRTYEAVLKAKSGDAPIANKKVAFRLEGKNGTSVPNGGIAMGEGTTDAQGRAQVVFTTPDLAQGSYALKASFAGDPVTGGDDAEANLMVLKAPVKFHLSDFNWFEAGSNIGYIGVSLVRDSDQKGVARPISLTVNGKPKPLPATSVYHQIVLEPLEAKSWTVKVQFAGDASTLATSAERTYTRPAK